MTLFNFFPLPLCIRQRGNLSSIIHLLYATCNMHIFFLDNDCSLLPQDLFQSLSSELGIPLLLENELPSEADSDLFNQITKDVSQGEFATSFENFDTNVFQENSGISFI